MIRTKLGWAAMAAMLVCAGCDETNPCPIGMYEPGPPRLCRLVDGGAIALDDGGAPPDAGAADAAPTDAAGNDATLPDGGIAADAGSSSDAAVVCPGDTVRLRGTCVESCGADLAGLDTALGVGVGVVGHLCRPARARAVVVGPAPGFDAVLYELQASGDASTTDFAIRRVELDGTSVRSDTLLRMAGTSPGGVDMSTFVSGFLAMNSDQSEAMFGYTQLGAGFPGNILRWSLPTGPNPVVSAPGNYDAVYAGTSILVNGLGLGVATDGNGLYAADPSRGVVRAFSGLGDYSGGVIILSEGLPGAIALVGGTAADMWPDGSAGSKVFALPMDIVIGQALLRGVTYPAFDPQYQRFDWPTGLFALRGQRFATTDYDDPVVIREYSWDATSEQLVIESTEIAASGAFSSVLEIDDGVLALAHRGGLLLVQVE